MKPIVVLRDEDIFPVNYVHKQDKALPLKRVAVRVIVFDSDERVALCGTLYQLLPGGGVENNETLEQSAIREVLEEVGCKVKIENYIGFIEEFRDGGERYQITHCFSAKVIGEKGAPQTSQKDELGMKVYWHNIEETQDLLEKQVQSIPFSSYNSCFNARLSLAFIKEYRALYTNKSKNDACSESMRKIYEEIINLKSSPLYDYRIQNDYQPVIGEGSLDARIMIIGEAPGKNEALSGKPFCGKSGQILDELLGSVHLKRSDVYITNLVKDRPEENRDPTDEEINIYAPFLDKQIDLIKPEVIVTLGRFSMNHIMKRFSLESEVAPISKNHGRIYKMNAKYGAVKIIPLYHPAASIYNQSLKGVLFDDFKAVC